MLKRQMVLQGVLVAATAGLAVADWKNTGIQTWPEVSGAYKVMADAKGTRVAAFEKDGFAVRSVAGDGRLTEATWKLETQYPGYYVLDAAWIGQNLLVSIVKIQGKSREDFERSVTSKGVTLLYNTKSASIRQLLPVAYLSIQASPDGRYAVFSRASHEQKKSPALIYSFTADGEIDKQWKLQSSSVSPGVWNENGVFCSLERGANLVELQQVGKNGISRIERTFDYNIEDIYAIGQDFCLLGKNRQEKSVALVIDGVNGLIKKKVFLSAKVDSAQAKVHNFFYTPGVALAGISITEKRVAEPGTIGANGKPIGNDLIEYTRNSVIDVVPEDGQSSRTIQTIPCNMRLVRPFGIDGVLVKYGSLKETGRWMIIKPKQAYTTSVADKDGQLRLSVVGQ